MPPQLLHRIIALERFRQSREESSVVWFDQIDETCFELEIPLINQLLTEINTSRVWLWSDQEWFLLCAFVSVPLIAVDLRLYLEYLLQMGELEITFGEYLNWLLNLSEDSYLALCLEKDQCNIKLLLEHEQLLIMIWQSETSGQQLLMFFSHGGSSQDAVYLLLLLLWLGSDPLLHWGRSCGLVEWDPSGSWVSGFDLLDSVEYVLWNLGLETWPLYQWAYCWRVYLRVLRF